MVHCITFGIFALWFRKKIFNVDLYFGLVVLFNSICNIAMTNYVKYRLADNMRQGKKKILTVPSQSDAPEESDLWTAWQLFLLDDDQTCHSKDGGSDTSQWPVIERNRAGQLGWQYGTSWRSHRAATKWCTERKWLVNCMTVISARWRSHIPFQRWRKWHIPIARYQKKLRGRGGVSIYPRGSLKVI